MNKSQLEHIIRAAGAIANVQDVLVFGSQAILGQFPGPGLALGQSEQVIDSSVEDIQAILVRSMEVDILIPSDETKADLIDGSIGELSAFHHTYGYYAQGIDQTTAMLPEGWQTRLIVICNVNTNYVRGHCLEIHDLLISKLYAGRQKDLEFFQAARRLQLFNADTLLQRLDSTPIANERRAIIQRLIEQRENIQ